MTGLNNPLIADRKRSPWTNFVLYAVTNRLTIKITMVLGIILLLFAFLSLSPAVNLQLHRRIVNPNLFVSSASEFFYKYDLDSLPIDIDSVTINDLVIVSGYSKDHESEMKTFCKRLKSYKALDGIPYRLVIYGMAEIGKNETEEMRDYCPKQVEFRIFDFDKYPAYVRNLKEYRWKHLIIAQMLTESPLVFWVDSSVRFYDDPKQSIQTFIDYAKRPESLNVVQLGNTGHKVFPATMKEMFVRFSYPEDQAKKLDMHEANRVLWIRSPKTVKILKEMVTCSLEKACMAPKGARLHCNSTGSTVPDKFAGCHRFDQSALAVVLSKEANFDLSRYAYTGGELTFLKVERGT